VAAFCVFCFLCFTHVFVVMLATDEDSDEDKRHSDDNRNEKKSKEPKKLEVLETFEAMDLKPDLLRGMYGAGFERPSAIQQRAIAPILRRRDVVAQAQSGTGKTSTLAIVSLQLCDVQKREVQVLVLSPTREIATQLESTMNLIGTHMSLLVHCCIGNMRSILFQSAHLKLITRWKICH
jgi:ATP-dependent RNA helicase